MDDDYARIGCGRTAPVPSFSILESKNESDNLPKSAYSWPGSGRRLPLVAMRRSQRLGLSGWVRNRRDGSVEALVSGPVEALDVLLLWAQRGPSMARVNRVLCNEGNAAEIGVTAGFRQIATR